MDLSCIIQSGDLELYVMGMLPEDESRKVEELARIFPEIRAELDAISMALENAAMQSAVTPSSSVKEKILSSLPAQHAKLEAPVVSLKPTNQKTSVSRMAAAASWVLVVILGGLGAYLYNSNTHLHKDIATLKQNSSQYEQQMGDMGKKVMAFETYHRLKNDSSINAVSLKGNVAGVEVFWNKATQEVYIDPSSLPQTPAGKQYQLWYIADGKPVDAGMIDLSDSTIIQKMKNCPNAQAFAITIEKTGGSQVPTSTPILVGTPG